MQWLIILSKITQLYIRPKCVLTKFQIYSILTIKWEIWSNFTNIVGALFYSRFWDIFAMRLVWSGSNVIWVDVKVRYFQNKGARHLRTRVQGKRAKCALPIPYEYIDV